MPQRGICGNKVALKPASKFPKDAEVEILATNKHNFEAFHPLHD